MDDAGLLDRRRYPLIGSLADEGLYIATGFGGWGLTTAGVAGAIIRDFITQAHVTEEYRDIFDVRRELAAPDSTLISARTSSGTDRDAHEIIRGLADGDSAVVRSHGEQLAVHRSDEGQLETVSAVCTHAGGIVLWNDSDAQWACPCHGSKFSPDGSVIQGPAEAPLPDKSHLLDE